jgi:uncharacterized protein
MRAPKLLIALHDVSPVHRARLERAEELLSALGVREVTYLLVPDFHGGARADASAEFVAWCRAARAYRVQWFLHGYFHDQRLEVGDVEHAPTVPDRLAMTFTTAGEAECVRLGAETLRKRLAAGMTVFKACVGTSPTGFVAPAWLFNRHLVPALKELRFDFTESQLRVVHVATGREVVTPMVTWATRTWFRRSASIAAAALARRIWQERPIVRLALHPHDFDHAETVASVSRTLEALRKNREVMSYSTALFESEPASSLAPRRGASR